MAAPLKRAGPPSAPSPADLRRRLVEQAGAAAVAGPLGELLTAILQAGLEPYDIVVGYDSEARFEFYDGGPHSELVCYPSGEVLVLLDQADTPDYTLLEVGRDLPDLQAAWQQIAEHLATGRVTASGAE